MIAAAGLLALALLVQPQPRTYYWRDAAGQTHITNTPPPSDAEILEPPQAPAVAPGKAGRPEVVRQSASHGGQRQALSLVQKQAWDALDQHLAKARAAGDRRTLEAVPESLIQDCLWGNGLWAMPILPVLSVLLMGLLGWWLALGLRTGTRIPMIAGFLLLGLAFGHLLLNAFLYNPQAARLRRNLELLEQHVGTGKALRPEHRVMLQQRYRALEEATSPIHPPWLFQKELKTLREAVKQVMVEP